MATEFVNKVLDALGLGINEEDGMDEMDVIYDDLESQDYDHQASHRKRNRVIRTAEGELSMVLVKPKDHSDAQMIIDSLKGRKPVIVNLENNDFSEAQRVIDFVSGAVYALGGDVKEISKKIFAIVPANVGFSTGE